MLPPYAAIAVRGIRCMRRGVDRAPHRRPSSRPSTAIAGLLALFVAGAASPFGPSWPAAATAADPLRIVLDSAFGGAVYALESDRDRLYAVVGQRIVLFDAALRPIARTGPLPGQIGRMAYSGRYLYVATGTAGIAIVAPGADVGGVVPIVGWLKSAGTVSALSIGQTVGGLILYAESAGRIWLYDLADPTTPRPASSLSLDGLTGTVAAIEGGAALVQRIDHVDHLAIIAAANTGRPRVVATVRLPPAHGNLYHRLIVGGHWIVAANGQGSAIVDITDPLLPRLTVLPYAITDGRFEPGADGALVLIGSEVDDHTSRTQSLIWLSLDGVAAVVLDREPVLDSNSGGIALLDGGRHVAVSRFENGIALYGPRQDDGTRARTDWASGGRAIAADVLSGGDVAVLMRSAAGAALDILNGGDGERVGSIAISSNLGFVSAIGDRVYVCGSSDVTEVFDVSRRDEPVRLATGDRTNPGGCPMHAGRWAALAGRTGLALFDATGGILAETPIATAPGPGAELIDAVLGPDTLAIATGAGITVHDLPDLTRGRTLYARPSGAAPFYLRAVVAAGDAWLIANLPTVGAVALQLHPDGSNVPRDLFPDGTRVHDAVVRGDRAIVVSEPPFGSTTPAQLVVFDLAHSQVLASEPVLPDTYRLAADGSEPQLDTVVSPLAWQGLLRWRVEAHPMATTTANVLSTPLATNTRELPAPTQAAPSASRTAGTEAALFLPFAARATTALNRTARIVSLGHYGGPANNVVASGGMAWLNEGPDIVAVDIAGDTPREVGRVAVCPPLDVPCGRLAVGGGRVAVVDAATDPGHPRVRIADVSDARRPRLAGFVVLPDRPFNADFDVVAPHANAARFVLLGRVGSSGVMEKQSAVFVIDATDADRPRIVHAVDRPDGPGRLVGGGGRLYFIGSDGTFAEQGGQGWLETWSLSGDGRIEVLDRFALSDPDIAQAASYGHALPVAVDGARIVIDTSGNRTTIVDLGDPEHPIESTSFDVMGGTVSIGLAQTANAIALIGDRFIVGQPLLRGVAIVQRIGTEGEPPPTSLVGANTWFDPNESWSGPNMFQPRLDQRFAVDGGRLVIAGGEVGGLTVVTGIGDGQAVSIHPFERPGIVRAVLSVPDSPSALLTLGGAPDVLTRLDLGADKPVVRASGSAIADDMARSSVFSDYALGADLAMAGHEVWAGDFFHGLARFSVTAGGPAVPLSVVARTEGERLSGFRIAVTADQGWVWTADPARGLRGHNASAGSASAPDVAYATGGAPEDVVLDGGRLYVADGPAGVLVLDVSDPATPREMARLRLPGSAVRLLRDDASTLWVAVEVRPDSVQPLGTFGGGRGWSAIAALDAGLSGTPTLRGVTTLPLRHVHDIVRHDDLLLVAGALPGPPDGAASIVVGPLDVGPLVAGLVAVDASDPDEPFVSSQWRDDAGTPLYSGVAALGDGRVAVAGGLSGARMFAVER